MRPAILESGIESVVPLSNEIVYGRFVTASEELEETSNGNGMSITVSETSIPEIGSIRST